MYEKSSISERPPRRFWQGCLRTLVSGLAGLVLVMSTASALAPGDTPPPIGMSDRTGRIVDLQDLKGKVVVIDFWASWCRPCRQEMPVLEALHEKYAADGLVIIGINIDSSVKKMNKFLEGAPVSFRIVHDRKLEIASRYEPPTMPSSYFISRDGKVRYIHKGFSNEDAPGFEARIKTLLADASTETSAVAD
jgi:thiol-disulfide isomerase/thioredoxin